MTRGAAEFLRPAADAGPGPAWDEGRVRRDGRGRFSPAGESLPAADPAARSASGRELADRPPAPPAWADHGAVMGHVGWMVGAHDADPHVAALREREAALQADYDRADLRFLAFDPDWEAKSRAFAAREAAAARLTGVREALWHEGVRTLHRAFGLPAGGQAAVAVEAPATPGGEVCRARWDQAAAVLGPVMAAATLGDVRVRLGELPPGGRAGFDRNTGTLWVCPADPPATLAHEFGHLLNERPAAADRVDEFRRRRFMPDQDVKDIGKLFPEREYLDGEGGNPDFMRRLFPAREEFCAYYVGKTYPGTRQTEVLSMGLELVVRDPMHFARTDPDYFALVMGCIQGVRTKGGGS